MSILALSHVIALTFLLGWNSNKISYCYRQNVSWERFLVTGKHVQYIFLEQGLLFMGISTIIIINFYCLILLSVSPTILLSVYTHKIIRYLIMVPLYYLKDCLYQIWVVFTYMSTCEQVVSIDIMYAHSCFYNFFSQKKTRKNHHKHHKLEVMESYYER